MHKVWLATDPNTFKPRSDWDRNSSRGYNKEEGSKGQHWTLSNSLVSTELLRCKIPRSIVFKQLWVPSSQVLTSLHVFQLRSASKWYCIPLYQEPFRGRTYKCTFVCTVFVLTILAHDCTGGHQNGHHSELRHNYDVSAITLYSIWLAEVTLDSQENGYWPCGD